MNRRKRITLKSGRKMSQKNERKNDQFFHSKNRVKKSLKKLRKKSSEKNDDFFKL